MEESDHPQPSRDNTQQQEEVKQRFVDFSNKVATELDNVGSFNDIAQVYENN